VSYFASVTLGAIVVPLNDHYQQTELLYFLDECGVSLLVTSHEFAPLCQQVLSLQKGECKVFFVEDQTGAAESELISLGDLAMKIDSTAPVMYQFSSGSTGRPKRIARTHANLLFELDSLLQTLQITSEDRFLGVAPFSHVNGLMRSMLASVRAGAPIMNITHCSKKRELQSTKQQPYSEHELFAYWEIRSGDSWLTIPKAVLVTACRTEARGASS